MPLNATLDERYEAQKASQKARYHQRIADGLCGQCGREREPERAEKRICRACQTKASQAHWRWQQGRLKGRRPVTHDWNFDTDDLIVGHIDLAKTVARCVKQKLGPSSTADVDDLIGDALYGLVRAGRTFDEGRGIQFGAWAHVQIRGEVYHGLRRWLKRTKERPIFVPLEDVERDEWE